MNKMSKKNIGRKLPQGSQIYSGGAFSESDALKVLQAIKVPSHLRYTEEHVWALLAENATGLYMVGVTEVVTRRFLTISSVELPKELEEVTAGDSIATISGFSNFDRVEVSYTMHAPLTGTIGPVNPILRNRLLRRARPDSVKLEPYGRGWIFGIIGELDKPYHQLMSAKDYHLYLESLAIEDPRFLYCFND